MGQCIEKFFYSPEGVELRKEKRFLPSPNRKVCWPVLAGEKIDKARILPPLTVVVTVWLGMLARGIVARILPPLSCYSMVRHILKSGFNQTY